MLLEKIRRRILAGKILKQAMWQEGEYSSGRVPYPSIWDGYWEKEKKRIKKIGKFPDTKKVLSAHDKKPDDIYEIRKDLLLSSVGIFNSALIIINPEYLNLYLEKKAEGLTQMELALFLKGHIRELV